MSASTLKRRRCEECETQEERVAASRSQKKRKAIYEFHVRAFGEELARVNFLPVEERRRYVAEMVDHALSKGVKFEKPALGVTP
jgi:hypothetical protein